MSGRFPAGRYAAWKKKPPCPPGEAAFALQANDSIRTSPRSSATIGHVSQFWNRAIIDLISAKDLDSGSINSKCPASPIVISCTGSPAATAFAA